MTICGVVGSVIGLLFPGPSSSSDSPSDALPISKSSRESQTLPNLGSFFLGWFEREGSLALVLLPFDVCVGKSSSSESEASDSPTGWYSLATSRRKR